MGFGIWAGKRMNCGGRTEKNLGCRRLRVGMKIGLSLIQSYQFIITSKAWLCGCAHSKVFNDNKIRNTVYELSDTCKCIIKGI